ncbi:transporter substrate-binding domain-containing protein [Dolosicoccus paucivorans]|uniref:ABC transporter substrate-binding protein n=1 Tax=Dolosicoccus paucivorans TaxID=84521 RepID=A0A2N6SMV2_9LACT|nr:transporter substrate-binding domain-containing protein [Dolosicoccus paucivorans]PMB84489.1 ABC transporter substrate-binding protein [Dolosicoccus paucivorans]PMC58391.1 ABC transporter substrate-binding protein [Dolosicoccus paucivorans]
MKILKRILVALLVLIAAFSHLVKTKANESFLDDGVLDVAISGTLYPANYYDDERQLKGYNVEILQQIAKELGVEIKFHEMGVDGMFASLTSGQVDLVGEGLEPNKQREEDFLIGEPIKYSFTSIIIRSDGSSNIDSLEDYQGKKAAGAATTDYMQIANQLGAEMVVYDNATNEQYLLDVAHGRTDFIPNDYYLQKSALEYFKDLDIKMGDLFYNPSTASFVYRKDAEALKEKVDEIIQKMKKDGQLAGLSKKYYNGEDVSVQKEEINGVKIKDLPVIELDH